jgi:hypothetical protein
MSEGAEPEVSLDASGVDHRQERERLCPSGRCEEGAMLLGIVGADGTVGYVRPPAVIDEAFVTEVKRRGDPERRFRFAQPCVEADCSQWTGSRCGVIERVLEAAVDAAAIPQSCALPACGIRPVCRWFAQEGTHACAVCPLVVTDLRPRGRFAASPPDVPQAPSRRNV